MAGRPVRLAALVVACLLTAPLTAAGRAAAAAGRAAAAAPPMTFHVVVGGMVDGQPQVDLQSFYPRVAVIHVGDRVDFEVRGLHTVSFVPHGMAVPQPIVGAPGVYPPVGDAAGRPFWWAGTVPRLQFNPAVALPTGGATVDGRRYVNSGLPTGPDFRVVYTFTRPGRYIIHCLIHPRMTGTVLVKPPGTVIPGPALQRRIGQAQSALDTARALTRDQTLTLRSRRFTHMVIVGAGTVRYSLMAFYPRRLTVHVGQSVTFRLTGVNEIHTVTFGPGPYVDAIEARLFPPPPPAPPDRTPSPSASHTPAPTTTTASSTPE
jgi:plastocyanin